MAVDVRVLALNAYLIPSMFVNADNQSCQQQEVRGAGIGRLIAGNEVDVAVLQEMWGAAMAQVEAPIAGTHEVLQYCKAWGMGSLVDAAVQYINRRGGLWMAYRKTSVDIPHADAETSRREGCGGHFKPTPVGIVSSMWMTYSFSNTKSKKGANAVCFDVLQNDLSKRLVVINTHFDPMNTNSAIERQSAELATFISKVLQNPKFVDPSVGAARTSVLLVGDLNTEVNGSDPLAAAVRERLGTATPPNGITGAVSGLLAGGKVRDRASRDLYGEFCRTSGSRPGATYTSRENGLVMWDSHVRIDWQLAIDRWDNVDFAHVNCKNASLVTQPRGSELSDHWGIQLDLSI
ncbi:unnamed protein product [Effrenium voratum]|nr:unnamed protein product [Effrenium voratum]